jgi:hypothetical protein
MGNVYEIVADFRAQGQRSFLPTVSGNVSRLDCIAWNVTGATLEVMKVLWFLMCLTAPAWAQSAGISAEWDAQKMLTSLSSQSQRIMPVLQKLQPEAWFAQGAGPAYVAQWKSSQADLKAVVDVAAGLARQPEKLTLALDVYFRLQNLESNLNSLSEGARKYQNPALAELLLGVVAENAANRDRLRQYIADLAAVKEQELQIVDKEAQRCRATLSRQPAARKGDRK